MAKPANGVFLKNKIFQILDIFDELHVCQQKIHPSVSTAGSKCTEVASPQRESFIGDSRRKSRCKKIELLTNRHPAHGKVLSSYAPNPGQNLWVSRLSPDLVSKFATASSVPSTDKVTDQNKNM